MITTEKLYSTDAQCVVLDEADTLFDETFRHDIDALIGELPVRTHTPSSCNVALTHTHTHSMALEHTALEYTCI